MNSESGMAEKVAFLMGCKVEESEGKYKVIKNRTVEIDIDGVGFSCTLELDIYFKEVQGNGLAFNKAEIFLLPQECRPFMLALIKHELPLPSVYRQWQVANPNIVGMYLETIERPEHFAERLSKAFQAIEIGTDHENPTL